MLLLNIDRKTYMDSPIPWHLTLSDLDRSKLRCRKWSKIDTCIVRYCLRFNPWDLTLDFNWFTSLQKIANDISTAAVNQRAKVHGPLVPVFQNFGFLNFNDILALLDYVNRAHEIAIRPSVCGIDYLWSYCMDCVQILVVTSPGPYAQNCFSFLKKKKSFSLTWDPMEAKTSKRYSSLKSLLSPFKLFLNFLLSGPDKSTVLDFWNF